MTMLRTAWFLGMVLFSALLAVLIASFWSPRLGVELDGGTRLVYDVDRDSLQGDEFETLAPGAIDWNALVRAVQTRVDPSGTRGSAVRHLPPWQIEILFPEKDAIEIERTKRLITTAGMLEFRAVANPVDHQHLIDLAQQQAADAENPRAKYVRDGDQVVATWARVARDSTPTADGIRPFKVHVEGAVIRDAGSGRLIDLPAYDSFAPDLAVERFLAGQQIEEIEVLMAVDDGFDLTGNYLSKVSRAWDETGRPCVNFNMSSSGARLMHGLTSSNLPDQNRGFYRRLGIMLDGTLLTAPRIMSAISDRGRIAGSFTQEEVDFLVNVLNAGSLPAPLRPRPVAEINVLPVPRALRVVVLTLCASFIVILLLWLVLLLRHGWVGAGLASLVQVLLVVAAISLLHITVTPPLVLAAAVTAVLAAVGNEVICEFARQRKTPANGTPRSEWRGLATGTALIAFLFGGLFIAGLVMYAISLFSIRSLAIGMTLGSAAALLTGCLSLPALIALDIAARNRESDDQDLITAELV